MVSLTKLLVGTGLLVVSVHADALDLIYHKDTFGPNACSALIGKKAILFNATTDKAGYCNVNNQQALGSMAHCIEQIPYKKARESFLESCKTSKHPITEEQYLDSFNNATQYLVSNVTADKSYNAKKIYYKPVSIPKKTVLGGWNSEIGRFYNYNRASWYGIALMSYWFAVMFAAGICNLAYFLFPGFVKKFTGAFVNGFRRYFTLPALFGQSHAHHKQFLGVFQFLFPTRLESILVFGWFAMAFVFSAVNYKHDSPNLFWPTSESAEIGRKIADRTGIMSLWLMAPLILFAGRNNFMQWLSGWPYARFVYIHKWMSRTTFLLMMVHGVGMTYNGKGVGKYLSRNAQMYVRMGYVAVVAASIMVFQSLAVFRKANYEVFLGVHILMAIIFIAGAWIHVREDGYAEWMYAAAAVWVFDRAVRIGRLVAFGVRKAEVRLIANETLRVTVSRPAYWKPYPGCIAYIHFLRPSCFWQSHPFTIVDSVAEEHTITFYIKVKGGVTHGLYQYLSKQPESTAHIKVTIEGPYGQPTAMSRFENTLFLAGGNGIPGMYYEATDIAKKRTGGVKLIWVVRHFRSLEWFYTELLKLKTSGIDTIIYVTQPHLGLVEPIVPSALSSSDDELDHDEEEEKKSDNPEESNDYIQDLKNKLSFIEFREGRPDVYDIVREEITQTNGPLAIASCAHASMVDEARKSVSENLGATSYRVDLFEQLQTW